MGTVLPKNTAEPLRVCEACGAVLSAGRCPGCAPSVARGYADVGASTALFSGSRSRAGSSAVDARRSSSEWSVSPDELDPQTRKAHPSQLRATRAEDVEAPGLVRRLASDTSRRYSASPDAPRLFARAPEGEVAQAGATARHTRPVSPLRAKTGPIRVVVSASAEAEGLEATPPQRGLPESSIAPMAESGGNPAVAAAPAKRARRGADARNTVPPALWLLLALGAVAGVVAALL